jgi:3-hydroxyacyl-CoA dehydrogenase
MVASGRLGRKTGRAFYNYRAGEQPPSTRWGDDDTFWHAHR